ncbi:MAG: Gfo/Idh/MocA family protein [Chitinophagales bacterium]
MKERVKDVIKVGLLSFAHMHAYSYASALKALPGVELVGIADEDAVRGREAAARFGTEYVPDYEMLLARTLDAVVICSANAQHAELTIAAAKAGKHVLVEKPIATNVADAHRMIDACREAGVQLQVAFPVRYQPAVARVKALIDQGIIGRVVAVKGTNHGQMPGGWFIDRAQAGGGAVMDHTVHVVDLMRWFLGKEVISVYAEVGDSLLHPGLGIDDAGLLSMELEGGTFATLDTSWSRPQSFPVWGDVTMEIVGTGGVISLDAFAQNVQVYSDVEGKASWENWGDDMNVALVRDFVESVRTGQPVKVTGHDGLKAMEVALAAYRASAEGRTVRLAEL